MKRIIIQKPKTSNDPLILDEEMQAAINEFSIYCFDKGFTQRPTGRLTEWEWEDLLKHHCAECGFTLDDLAAFVHMTWAFDQIGELFDGVETLSQWFEKNSHYIKRMVELRNQNIDVIGELYNDILSHAIKQAKESGENAIYEMDRDGDIHTINIRCKHEGHPVNQGIDMCMIAADMEHCGPNCPYHEDLISSSTLTTYPE